jgi:hypothetical protein
VSGRVVGLDASHERTLSETSDVTAALHECTTAQTGARCEGVPTLADLSQIIDELISLTPQPALLQVNLCHSFARFAQSFEGVGAAAPSNFEGSYHVGGVLRSGSRLCAQCEPRRALLVLV